MKSILLYGLAPDNAGNYHHAGATLAVGDAADQGIIAADRAAELVAIGSASPVEDAKGADSKGADRK